MMDFVPIQFERLELLRSTGGAHGYRVEQRCDVKSESNCSMLPFQLRPSADCEWSGNTMPVWARALKVGMLRIANT